MVKLTDFFDQRPGYPLRAVPLTLGELGLDEGRPPDRMTRNRFFILKHWPKQSAGLGHGFGSAHFRSTPTSSEICTDVVGRDVASDARSPQAKSAAAKRRRISAG